MVMRKKRRKGQESEHRGFIGFRVPSSKSLQHGAYGLRFRVNSFELNT